MNKLLGPVALCVVLSGCGGGGSGCTPQTVRIQLFGDSTQWGFLAQGGGVRASVYPELALQQRMDLRFGEGAVKVTTRAVSGTTSGQLLAGTDGLNAPWPQSVDADIVIINHGVNDVAYNVPPETYRANLEALTHAPAAVVFETPLPVSTATTDYAQMMRDVAAETRGAVIDARAYALSLSNWFQRYATDGVHETDEGYSTLVNGAVFPTVEPLVAKLRCEAAS